MCLCSEEPITHMRTHGSGFQDSRLNGAKSLYAIAKERPRIGDRLSNAVFAFIHL